MLFGLLAFGLFGLFTSTVFTGIAAVGAAKFLRSKPSAGEAPLPSLSLMKPLHGAEPDLAAHLATFFEQDYPAPFEVLFCAKNPDDPGLQVAREVASRYPRIRSHCLSMDGPVYVNAKVSSLERMAAVARHDVWVVSDSDVRVAPSYLREIAVDFTDPALQASTCLYRGVADEGLWAKLEASGMTVELTAGVLAANLLEGMRVLLGPTMTVRRDAVERMGGFGRLGPYCSDDFLLGNWIAEGGGKVVLSRHVIDHIVLNLTFLTSMKHQIRWMKSTRFSRPKGHFGTGLTFSLPWGLLAFAAALGLGRPRLAAAALGWSVLSRMALAALTAGPVTQDPAMLRTVLLFPVRDLMGFFFWAASYTSGRILWRGEVFHLGTEGRMERVKGGRKTDPLSLRSSG